MVEARLGKMDSNTGARFGNRRCDSGTGITEPGNSMRKLGLGFGNWRLGFETEIRVGFGNQDGQYKKTALDLETGKRDPATGI